MNGKTVTASEKGQTVLVVQSGIVTVTGDGKFTGTASETARGLLSAWDTGTLIFNNSTIDANGVYYGITAFVICSTILSKSSCACCLVVMKGSTAFHTVSFMKSLCKKSYHIICPIERRMSSRTVYS